MRRAQCKWGLFAVAAWLACDPSLCAAQVAAAPPAQEPTEPTDAGIEAAPITPDAATPEATPDAATTDAATPEPAEAARPVGDEVISDPELAGTPSEAARAGSDDVIVDPELAGTRAQSEAPPPSVPNGQMRILLHSRFGVDTRWHDPTEDVFENTNIVLLEARIRRSERLRFEVGVRARYMFASQEHATEQAGARRYELDLMPTAAYADATLIDGLHLRLGYQGARLGRFDVLNPSDVLSTYDLRSGFSTMPDANEIAQPALRVDLDVASFLSLTAIGVPFFAPHVARAFQGDYALAHGLRLDLADDARALCPIAGSAALACPAATINAPGSTDAAMAAAATTAEVRAYLSRSQQGRLQDGAFSAFTPDPNLKHPQAALRALMHGTAGELGFTAGTALEHLPAPEYSTAFRKYLDKCSQSATSPGCMSATNTLNADPVPIQLTYPRYELLSLDGAIGVGPVQLGAELAYMFGRAQFTQPPLASSAATQGYGLPVQTDVVHAGARAEWVRSTDWVIALEMSADRAMKAPPPNQRYVFMTHDRWLLAAIGFITMDPLDIGLQLELGAGLLNGPTYLLAPRIEQRIVDRFYVELGAALVAGKTYPFGDPRLTIGQFYSGANQVFLGLRWLP